MSKDPVKSQKSFKEKNDLPFELLSDESGDVCESYRVLTEMPLLGKKNNIIKRTTYIIDENGNIAEVFENVKVKGHEEEVIKALKEL